jgi:uncharacterized protein
MDVAGFDLWALLPFILIGFAAQIVDGALGMAYGVISSTLLVSVLGVPPAQASAGVHLAEIFTTGASGLSHAFLKNIDWRLFLRLVVPGVIGGLGGVWLLSQVDVAQARPAVMAYLATIGLLLLYRSWRFPTPKFDNPRIVVPLGLVGGFLDASGGGGWGPVVTSNLLLQGSDTRKTVGTVNAVEFVLTSVISVGFFFSLGAVAFTLATAGLLIGGVLAAPVAAFATRHVQPRLLLGLVGAVLTLTSAFSIWKALT